MQASEIITRAARLLGLSSADVLADAALLDEFLGYANDAVRSIERHGPWRWLMAEAAITTTSGVETIDLPADFAALQVGSDIFAADGNWGRLCLVEPLHMLHLRSQTPSSGRPAYYSPIFEPNELLWRLQLWPKPDAAIGLRVPYRRRVAAMADTTERPQIPEELHELAAIGAAAEAEEQREKVQAGSQRAKFAGMLAQAWTEHSTPVTDQRPIRLSRIGDERSLADRFRDQPITINVTS